MKPILSCTSKLFASTLKEAVFIYASLEAWGLRTKTKKGKGHKQITYIPMQRTNICIQIVLISSEIEKREKNLRQLQASRGIFCL